MAELDRAKEELFTELEATRRRLAQAELELTAMRGNCGASPGSGRGELDRAKAEFINAASHELRTPLSTIMAYAEFMEDDMGGALTASQQAYLLQIQEGARRLQRIVDDLLEFASLQTNFSILDWQQTDLAELLRSQVDVLAPRAVSGGVTMTLALEVSPCVIMADPGRVSLVIDHLIDNALKFTCPGGRVNIRLGQMGETVRIEVADTGIGIAPEHLENLFHTSFYQVEPSLTRTHGGAGLGLSLCRAIVLAHGGSIGVHSEETQGSTFWFTLPIRQKVPRTKP